MPIKKAQQAQDSGPKAIFYLQRAVLRPKSYDTLVPHRVALPSDSYQAPVCREDLLSGMARAITHPLGILTAPTSVLCGIMSWSNVDGACRKVGELTGRICDQKDDEHAANAALYDHKNPDVLARHVGRSSLTPFDMPHVLPNLQAVGRHRDAIIRHDERSRALMVYAAVASAMSFANWVAQVASISAPWVAGLNLVLPPIFVIYAALGVVYALATIIKAHNKLTAIRQLHALEKTPAGRQAFAIQIRRLQTQQRWSVASIVGGCLFAAGGVVFGLMGAGGVLAGSMAAWGVGIGLLTVGSVAQGLFINMRNRRYAVAPRPLIRPYLAKTPEDIANNVLLEAELRRVYHKLPRAHASRSRWVRKFATQHHRRHGTWPIQPDATIHKASDAVHKARQQHMKRHYIVLRGLVRDRIAMLQSKNKAYHFSPLPPPLRTVRMTDLRKSEEASLQVLLQEASQQGLSLAFADVEAHYHSASKEINAWEKSHTLAHQVQLQNPDSAAVLAALIDWLAEENCFEAFVQRLQTNKEWSNERIDYARKMTDTEHGVIEETQETLQQWLASAQTNDARRARLQEMVEFASVAMAKVGERRAIEKRRSLIDLFTRRRLLAEQG